MPKRLTSREYFLQTTPTAKKVKSVVSSSQQPSTTASDREDIRRELMGSVRYDLCTQSSQVSPKFQNRDEPRKPGSKQKDQNSANNVIQRSDEKLKSKGRKGYSGIDNVKKKLHVDSTPSADDFSTNQE